MISKEEVIRIAKLARIELSDQEIEKMQKDLSAVLDYFDLLKKAEKQKTGKKEFLKDFSAVSDVAQTADKEIMQRIIAAFPEKKDDYIKVKNVL